MNRINKIFVVVGYVSVIRKRNYVLRQKRQRINLFNELLNCFFGLLKNNSVFNLTFIFCQNFYKHIFNGFFGSKKVGDVVRNSRWNIKTPVDILSVEFVSSLPRISKLYETVVNDPEKSSVNWFVSFHRRTDNRKFALVVKKCDMTHLRNNVIDIDVVLMRFIDNDDIVLIVLW